MYIIYKTTNLVNNKIYIGVHKTDKKDEYLGSGRLLIKAIKKYGEESFVRKVLFEYKYRKDAYIKESELVNEEFCLNRNTYNLRCGGDGGFDYINRSGISKFKGKKHTKETRKKISIISKKLRHTEETKRLISKKLKGRKITWKDKLKSPKTSEHKKKLSESLKRYYQNKKRKKKEKY